MVKGKIGGLIYQQRAPQNIELSGGKGRRRLIYRVYELQTYRIQPIHRGMFQIL